MLGLVVEDEGDRSGMNNEAAPHTVSDPVGSEQAGRHGVVVKGVSGADVFEPVG